MVSANCFNYNRFSNFSLEQKAKTTRSSFLGFVQRTFKELVTQGSALWELQNELLTHLGKPDGKAAFEQWLDSDEFGASRYIARSAMEISLWYSTLPAKVQRLVMKNCHRWSVAALRELPKLAVNLVRELVSRPQKQTAKSVRDCAAQMSEEEWGALAQHYGLSETDLENVKEQARIFAIAETPEDATTVIIRRGHVMKALEHLGFKPGQTSNAATGNSGGSKRENPPQVAIATYNLSEEDEFKLTQLAKKRGVTPNKLISQLLSEAPEFTSKEDEPAPEAASVEEIEQKYLTQIAELQNQLVTTLAQVQSLQQQLTERTAPTMETRDVKETAVSIKLVEAMVKEIYDVAPTAAGKLDVRSALANVGESTLLLVRRLVKSLKKVSAETYGDGGFAIDENQEVENWEPA